jgi:hypothetical protein
MTLRLLTVLLLLAAVALPQVLAAPPVPRDPASTSVGPAYRARVEAIARDLLWSNAQMLRAFERYEDAQSAIEKPKRNTDEQALRAEAASARASLLMHIKTVRRNAARLGAISPVPRAWKKTDDRLVESAWQWASALEALDLWLQHPSGAQKLEAFKHARRAQLLLDGARRDLWVRTDRAVRSKTYAD